MAIYIASNYLVVSALDYLGYGVVPRPRGSGTCRPSVRPFWLLPVPGGCAIRSYSEPSAPDQQPNPDPQSQSACGTSTLMTSRR